MLAEDTTMLPETDSVTVTVFIFQPELSQHQLRPGQALYEHTKTFLILFSGQTPMGCVSGTRYEENLFAIDYVELYTSYRGIGLARICFPVVLHTLSAYIPGLCIRVSLTPSRASHLLSDVSASLNHQPAALPTRITQGLLRFAKDIPLSLQPPLPSRLAATAALGLVYRPCSAQQTAWDLPGYLLNCMGFDFVGSIAGHEKRVGVQLDFYLSAERHQQRWPEALIFTEDWVLYEPGWV